jgi:hypothetical protein
MANKLCGDGRLSLRQIKAAQKLALEFYFVGSSLS